MTPAPKLVNRAADPQPAVLRRADEMHVSSPGDAAEIEATRTAARIVRMAAPASAYVAPIASLVAPRPALLARQAEGRPGVGSGLASDIAAARGSGNPL